MQEVIYLAGPYAHDSEFVQLDRERELTEAAAILARRGLVVYSPITHSAPLQRRGVKKTNAEWLEFDCPFMLLATRLVVITLPGWQRSVGVTREIAIFQSMGKPYTRSSVNALDKWAVMIAADKE